MDSLTNILHLLTDLLMTCKFQPELCCAGCTQTRLHMLTHNTCSLLSTCSQKPQQWMPQLCHVLIYLLVFICWVPQIMLTLPSSPQMRPYPLKREAENIHAISHVLLSQCFPLPWESSQVSTNQTQGSSNSTNSSQSMSSEAF